MYIYIYMYIVMYGCYLLFITFTYAYSSASPGPGPSPAPCAGPSLKGPRHTAPATRTDGPVARARPMNNNKNIDK